MDKTEDRIKKADEQNEAEYRLEEFLNILYSSDMRELDSVLAEYNKNKCKRNQIALTKVYKRV